MNEYRIKLYVAGNVTKICWNYKWVQHAGMYVKMMYKNKCLKHLRRMLIILRKILLKRWEPLWMKTKLIKLQALSATVNSELHFFQTIRFFCTYRENFTAVIYLCNNSFRNCIFFWMRDNSLLLGINFRQQKLIEASVSSKKSFKFLDFLKFYCIFPFGTAILTLLY